jgi:hypothetical protein
MEFIHSHINSHYQNHFSIKEGESECEILNDHSQTIIFRKSEVICAANRIAKKKALAWECLPDDILVT